MTAILQDHPLHPAIAPRGIAWFGASNRYTAMGTNMLASLQAMGFEGAVYPVHPGDKTVLGLRAYEAVADLPCVPDLAVLVLPTPIVAETLEACGRKGIPTAVIVSGGFGEAGDEGKKEQERLTAIAKKYGMRFIGPNCLGVINSHHRFNMTFLPCEARPGFIGMVSQSGSFITQMFDYLQGFGLGFSTGISVGNEADVDLVDGLTYLAACPHTRVIALYVEAIRRGPEFIEAARAIAPQKPIVAYYVGGSETGRKAGLSHTGALAGPDRLYDGVFRQAGIIRASSIEEMFDFCWALGTTPLPEGNRITIQTHSGGPGAVAADTLGRCGLELADLSPVTVEKLSPLVPHTGSIGNPVDLTFSKNPLDFFDKIPAILLQEPQSDGQLIYFLSNRQAAKRVFESMGVATDQSEEEVLRYMHKQAETMAATIRDSGKPVIGFSFLRRDNGFVRHLQDLGIAVIPGPERAARAMAALYRYRQFRDKLAG
jgi:acetyl-CoA synthetase (ADP-forming)